MGFINKQALSKVVYVVPVIFILLSIYVLLDNEKEEVKLDDVIVKENVSNKKGFAIMLQDEAGSDSYTPSESTSFPTEGYIFNSEKSECIDDRGYKIDGVLSYNDETHKVGVTTNKTVYCYVLKPVSWVTDSFSCQEIQYQRLRQPDHGTGILRGPASGCIHLLPDRQDDGGGHTELHDVRPGGRRVHHCCRHHAGCEDARQGRRNPAFA